MRSFERHPWRVGAAIALALMGVAEGALRLLQPEVYRFVYEARQVHRYDADWYVRLAPNRSARLRLHRRGAALYDFVVTTGTRGERIPPDPPLDPSGRARFVHAVGDSFTMGWGVAAEEAYPAQLDRLLAGRLRVVNLGVDGFGTLAAIGRSRELWSDWPPVAVVYLFSPNDFEDDAWAVRNGRRGRAWHAFMRGVDALRRTTYLANTPFVVKWWLYFDRAANVSPVRAGDGATILEEPSLPLPSTGPTNLSMDALRDFASFAASRRARLIVLVPDEGEGPRLFAFCKSAGIEAHLLGIPDALRIPAEGHLNPEGSRQLAGFVARLLESVR